MGYYLEGWTGEQVEAALTKALKGYTPSEKSITGEMLSDKSVSARTIDDEAVTGEKIAEKAILIQHLGAELISASPNLLNPANIGSNSFSISLTANNTYCVNKEDVYAFTYVGVGGEPTQVNLELTAVDGGMRFTVPNGASDIVFTYASIDKEHTMITEGSELPPHFKPYGCESLITDELLSSVYSELDTLRPAVDELSGASTYNLRSNALYRVTANADIAFYLPTAAQSCDQILVQATIESDISVDWGTEYFFNEETPYIEAGSYNFIFEYDGGKWYAGAIKKGMGESA